MFSNPFQSDTGSIFGMFSQFNEQLKKIADGLGNNPFDHLKAFSQFKGFEGFDQFKGFEGLFNAFSPENFNDLFGAANHPLGQVLPLMQNMRQFHQEMMELMNLNLEKDSDDFRSKYSHLLEKFSHKLYMTLSGINTGGLIRHYVRFSRDMTAMMKNGNNPLYTMYSMPGVGSTAEMSARIKDFLDTAERCSTDLENLLSLFDNMENKVSLTFVDLCLKKPADIDTGVSDFFDIWVKAYETEYKNLSSTAIYADYYGKFTNSSLKLRGLMQTHIDDCVEQFGLPSKRSTDTMLGHIASLRKQNRKLAATVSELETKIESLSVLSQQVSAPREAESAALKSVPAQRNKESEPVKPASATPKKPSAAVKSSAAKPGPKTAPPNTNHKN